MNRTRHRRSGITLLEITLAVAIIVPMLATMFIFYSNALRTNDENAERIRRVQLARVVLDRITRELRQSTGFSAGYGTGVFGTRHEISINTVVVPDKALIQRRGVREEPRPGQFDLRQVDYYIAWDRINLDENNDPRALGLVRRERRTFNKLEPEEVPEEGEGPEKESPGLFDGDNENANASPSERDRGAADATEQPGGTGPGVDDSPFDDELTDELSEEELEGAKRELYAPEIKFIEFFYHDGHRWWDSWEISEGNSLPQMVMVTIGYTPVLPEDEKMDIIDRIFEGTEEIEPLPEDRFMAVVRIPQADSFFGSRIQREASALADLEDVE
jgi:hypothetical protein